MSTVFTSFFPNARNVVFTYYKIPSKVLNIKERKMMIYEQEDGNIF